MMTDFELLLSGVPAFQARIAELRNSVLQEGPLDARGRTLALLAASLATGHPSVNQALIWAKQQGIRNDEIGHIAAIAAVLRATHAGVPADAGSPEAEQQQPAGCC